MRCERKATPSAARWAALLEKLATRQMPPKGRPRPDDDGVRAVVQWVNAEMKRAGKHSARREAYANGNAVPHHVLFDPANVPPYDGGPQVRRLSPEIYAGLTGELAKGKAGVGQPFSPEGRFTFKDMGAPKMDEPVTAQLIEAHAAHRGSVRTYRVGRIGWCEVRDEPVTRPADFDLTSWWAGSSDEFDRSILRARCRVRLSLSAQRVPKIVATDAAPAQIAFSPSSDAALVTVSGEAPATFGAYLIALANQQVDFVPLESPPLAAGVVPDADRAYIAQSHPEGRITFVSLATGELQSLTGFELAARIRQ